MALSGVRLYLGVLVITLTYVLVCSQQGGGDPEDLTNPHRDPSKCEVCKFVAIEMQGIMDDTGKSHETLDLNYRFDQAPKKIPYKFSELRFIEATEGVCERILDYEIHAERDSSLRIAKGESTTRKTINDLRKKGVKVELGMPDPLWNEPSAPIQKLKKYCETIVEEYEDVIEAWFKGNQQRTLIDYLCVERVLSREQSGCLREEWTGTERVDKGKVIENGANNEQAKLDNRKIQEEIERQAAEKHKETEEERKRQSERQRDRRKREKEMKRKQRNPDEL